MEEEEEISYEDENEEIDDNYDYSEDGKRERIIIIINKIMINTNKK